MAAIELIQKSTLVAVAMSYPVKKSVLLYQMIGVTNDGHKFAVQIKETLSTGRKQFMSVFPVKQ